MVSTAQEAKGKEQTELWLLSSPVAYNLFMANSKNIFDD